MSKEQDTTLPLTIDKLTFRGLGLPDKIAYAMELTMRFIPTLGAISS